MPIIPALLLFHPLLKEYWNTSFAADSIFNTVLYCIYIVEESTPSWSQNRVLSNFQLALAMFLNKIISIVCCHIISLAKLFFHCKVHLLSACVSRLLALAKTSPPLANCLLPMTKLQWGFGFLDQRGLFSSISTSPDVSFLAESELSHLVTEDMRCCDFCKKIVSSREKNKTKTTLKGYCSNVTVQK